MTLWQWSMVGSMAVSGANWIAAHHTLRRLIPAETLYQMRRDFKFVRGWEYELSRYPDRRAAKKALRWRGFWRSIFGASVVLFLGSILPH